MTDIIFAIGYLFQYGFHLVRRIGNQANFIFITIAFIFLVFWLRQILLFEKDKAN